MTSQGNQYSLSRRQSLAGIGGFTIGMNTGAVYRSLSNSQPDTITIDISLFTTERHLRNAPQTRLYSDEPNHAARVVQKLLQIAIPTLSTEETTVTPDVTIQETPVPDSIHEPTSREIHHAFNSYLLHERHEEIATHSNLLLTSQDTETERSGFATIRSEKSPLKRVQTAVFTDSLELYKISMDYATFRPYRTYEKNILVPLHEVGHNLGFDHKDGHVTDDPEWIAEHEQSFNQPSSHGKRTRGRDTNVEIPLSERKKHRGRKNSTDPGHLGRNTKRAKSNGTTDTLQTVYATVMANSYTRKLEGTTNNFGDQWPELDHRPSRTLPLFNPALNADHLS